LKLALDAAHYALSKKANFIIAYAANMKEVYFWLGCYKRGKLIFL